ncbi:hypothetical protein J5TS2_01620 [Brevibacillus halotolerans]|uniref:YcaO-like family protein n=1 Tax=Brevibacillus halotolerans TaxID=1507437 RepID=UPI001B0FE8D6|nr:YcaO-like family protein [Brevibacillus halotolerans]GIN99493.1 hypothetical protein J5TS2_01620 [Brevibacillus halotolerans]
MQKTSHPLEKLVQPMVGLISRVDRLPISPGEPEFPIHLSSLGDISHSLTQIKRATQGRSISGGMDGAGGSTDVTESRIRSMAEGLERYSSCTYDESQFIWATADELGDDAMDLRKVPVCSDAELRHPKCGVINPVTDAPIRWVKGISLLDQREVWVPAIMTYLHLSAESIGERFWLPISTGCAAHVSIEEALISAICEVIERDSISLTWLQQLPLPHIEFDEMDEDMRQFLKQTNKGGHIQQYIFDATTDIGVPTIYSVQITPHNRKLAALVMCATDLDPKRAIKKVMREAASSRIAMLADREIPENIDDFYQVVHGAVYMGKPEHIGAYDFLTNSPHRRVVSQLKNLDTGNAVENLNKLLNILSIKNLDAYVVDLTTDEALKVGMRVVRVIIPGLQPLSFSHRSRFLGHPRLYTAPVAMGYAAKTEEQLNPWPQPFA